METSDKDSAALFVFIDLFLMQLAKQTRQPIPSAELPLRILNASVLSTVEDERSRERIIHSFETGLYQSYRPLLMSFPLQRWIDSPSKVSNVYLAEYPEAHYREVCDFLVKNFREILESIHPFSGFIPTELEITSEDTKKTTHNFARFGLLFGIREVDNRRYIQAAGVVSLNQDIRSRSGTYPVLQEIQHSGKSHFL
jgi:hypothetical protein